MADELVIVKDKSLEQDNKGVILPPSILVPSSVHKYIDEELAKEHEHTQNGLSLKVDLETGANFVFAHKTKSGWEVDAYVGSNWSGKIRGGVQVEKRW